MKHFVNYRKRGVELPKGCKNLADVLNAPKQSKLKQACASQCEFCGAPAAFGWEAGMWSADNGKRTVEGHYWCERCDEDLKEFESIPENRLPKLPDDFEDPKATEPFERLIGEIEKRKKAFMRQRVAERKGPDHAV